MAIQGGLITPGMYTEVNTSPQHSGLIRNNQKLLFLSKEDFRKEFKVPVSVHTPSDADRFFDSDSVMHKMISAALKTNRFIDLQMCSDGNYVPKFKVLNLDISRFDPVYWRVDGPSTASFSLFSIANGFEVNFECRMSDDLVGVVWDSEDVKDHKYLAYETNKDYSGLKWEFDIELSDTMPVLNNEQFAPTLTVEYLDNQGRKGLAYIALYNYANNPSSRSAHIIIDFDRVKAGFSANVDFNVKNINKIFFSGFVEGYSQTQRPLGQTTSGFLRITNSVLTGSGTTLKLKQVQTDVHNIGMCTSYDDHYDLNPQRLVNNMKALGFSGFVNHYCGMSHYPAFNWDEGLSKFQIIDPLESSANLVNRPTTLWHEAYANALHQHSFEPVYSVSWELYSLAAREEWCQREYDDSIGRTGYEPPSYFMSMCHKNALTYIHKVYREFADTLVQANCKVMMQIGEPWHWFNTATLNPCVYDYQTRLAFNADTGLFAPDLGNIYEAVEKTGSPFDEFKTWLRNKLGQTCLNIRSMIKEHYGDEALVCPLLFFPSIRTHQESLATYINYPQEHYAYPNFDFVMTEAYDWVIEKTPRLDLSHQAVNEIPMMELGYPADKVAYLSGFVPDSAIAYIYKLNHETAYRQPIWQRIFGDIKNNESESIMKQLVWAYPQVMQDSIVIDSQYPGFFAGQNYLDVIQDNTPYPNNIFGEDLQPYQPPPVLKPVDVSAVIHADYSITISFDVENEKQGTEYEVQLLNSTGLYALISKFTATHSISISSEELSSVGLGTLLKVLIVPSEGEMSTIIDIDATPLQE